MQQVSIQIKLLTATRIHKIALKARSDSERIKSWSLQAKNEDGVTHTIYNTNVHTDRVEDRYIGATVKYFRYSVEFSIKLFALFVTDRWSRLTN